MTEDYGFVEAMIMEELEKEDSLRAISEDYDIADIVNTAYRNYDVANQNQIY